MTRDLDGLYVRTVLDHGRRPRNRRAMDGARKGEQHNPTCGDRITVYARMEHGVIRDVSFDGSACVIVLASASLMTEAVKDQTVTGAEAIAERVRCMVTWPGDGSFEDLGPLAALGGVRQFPMRVKCALLPWQALRLAAGHSGSR